MGKSTKDTENELNKTQTQSQPQKHIKASDMTPEQKQEKRQATMEVIKEANSNIYFQQFSDPNHPNYKQIVKYIDALDADEQCKNDPRVALFKLFIEKQRDFAKKVMTEDNDKVLDKTEFITREGNQYVQFMNTAFSLYLELNRDYPNVLKNLYKAPGGKVTGGKGINDILSSGFQLISKYDLLLKDLKRMLEPKDKDYSKVNLLMTQFDNLKELLDQDNVQIQIKSLAGNTLQGIISDLNQNLTSLLADYQSLMNTGKAIFDKHPISQLLANTLHLLKYIDPSEQAKYVQQLAPLFADVYEDIPSAKNFFKPNDLMNNAINETLETNKARRLASLKDDLFKELNQVNKEGSFIKKYSDPEHEFNKKLNRFLSAIPDSDPRKQLLVSYIGHLKDFAMIIAQFKENDPLELAQLIHEEMNKQNIFVFASLTQSLYANMATDYKAQLHQAKVDDSLVNDMGEGFQLFTKYQIVLERANKLTNLTTVENNNLLLLNTLNQNLTNRMNEIKLLDLSFFDNNFYVQAEKTTTINKLFEKVTYSSCKETELSYSKKLDGTGRNSEKEISEKDRIAAANSALQGVTNYLNINLTKLIVSSKKSNIPFNDLPLNQLLKNALLLLEVVDPNDKKQYASALAKHFKQLYKEIPKTLEEFKKEIPDAEGKFTPKYPSYNEIEAALLKEKSPGLFKKIASVFGAKENPKEMSSTAKFTQFAGAPHETSIDKKSKPKQNLTDTTSHDSVTQTQSLRFSKGNTPNIVTPDPEIQHTFHRK